MSGTRSLEGEECERKVLISRFSRESQQVRNLHIPRRVNVTHTHARRARGKTKTKKTKIRGSARVAPREREMEQQKQQGRGGMTRPRLKGCTDTEFQACARYLLGISSRHISVVTHRKTNHILLLPPPPPVGFNHRERARDRLTREAIFYLQRALSLSLSARCRLRRAAALILYAQEFLVSQRPDFMALIIVHVPPFSLALLSSAYLCFSFDFPPLHALFLPRHGLLSTQRWTARLLLENKFSNLLVFLTYTRAAR